MKWHRPVPMLECKGCKCLMQEAFKVVHEVYRDPSFPPREGFTQAYCGKCAPPYDRYSIVHNDGIHYYKLMRCNFDGTPWVDPMEHLKNAKASK